MDRVSGPLPPMHMHSISIVCLRSTSGTMDDRNRFPAALSTGIAQTADGYLWIGPTRALIRFDGYTFRARFISPPPASGVPILQMLTDAGGNCGCVHRGPISYAKKMQCESVRFGQTQSRSVER